MDRAQKAEQVAALKSTFEGTSVVIVTRNLGLTVAQSTALRLKMRDAGATYKVSKNKLARIAVEGTTYQAINDLLVGPTALSTSADPVAPAKVIVDFRRSGEGGATAAPRMALFHGQSGGESFHRVDGGCGESFQMEAGMGGETFEVPALAFGVNGVERE